MVFPLSGKMEVKLHEIEYFEQSYMHRIASEPEKTNELVKSVIRSKREGELLSNYKIETEDISKRIRDNIYLLFKDQDNINIIKKIDFHFLLFIS